MLKYKGYIGTVEAEDGVFLGRVAGLHDVITFEGTNFAEVEQAFRDGIDDYLAFCAQRGEAPDRPYSGKIPLRVSPDTHRRGRDARPIRGAEPQSMDRTADRERRLSRGGAISPGRLRRITAPVLRSRVSGFPGAD
jgi:predicted HicB family RNase H-like nuclease